MPCAATGAPVLWAGGGRDARRLPLLKVAAAPATVLASLARHHPPAEARRRHPPPPPTMPRRRAPSPPARREESGSVMELEHALALAERFHAGATDQAGRPYIEHVRRVVDGVTTDEQKLTAALHDLLEDTTLSDVDLLAAGCPPAVITAV